MSLTNLVLLCSTLATNTQVAVTSRTNNAAVLTYVETVRRLDVIAAKQRFHKPIPYQTNSTVISQRKWQEAVPDLTPSSPIMAPSSPVVRPGPTTVQPPAIKPSVVRTGGPNTNSPAFKRRQEMDARREKGPTATRPK